MLSTWSFNFLYSIIHSNLIIVNLISSCYWILCQIIHFALMKLCRTILFYFHFLVFIIIFYCSFKHLTHHSISIFSYSSNRNLSTSILAKRCARSNSWFSLFRKKQWVFWLASLICCWTDFLTLSYFLTTKFNLLVHCKTPRLLNDISFIYERLNWLISHTWRYAFHTLPQATQ